MGNLLSIIFVLAILVWFMGIGDKEKDTSRVEATATQIVKPPTNGMGAESNVHEEVKSDAATALTLFYRERLYKDAQCRGRDIDGNFWVKCISSQNDTQAPLFIVRGSVPRLWSITPVNDKARYDLQKYDFRRPSGHQVSIYDDLKPEKKQIEFATNVIR